MRKLIPIFALFAIVSCKSVQPIVVTQTRDSVRVEYRLDSIYLYEKDSVYIDRWRSNDTIFLTTEKWSVRYKDKEVQVHDTITVRDSIPVIREVPVVKKEVPSFYKNCTWGFFILILLIVVYILWRIFKGYIKAKIGAIGNIV